MKLRNGVHDTKVRRFMAGIAGFSVAVDSLSAIKYAKELLQLKMKMDWLLELQVEGEFPAFGNNDDRADKIAVELLKHS